MNIDYNYYYKKYFTLNENNVFITITKEQLLNKCTLLCAYL